MYNIDFIIVVLQNSYLIILPDPPLDFNNVTCVSSHLTYFHTNQLSTWFRRKLRVNLYIYYRTQPVTILKEEEKSDEDDDVPAWKKPKIWARWESEGHRYWFTTALGPCTDCDMKLCWPIPTHTRQHNIITLALFEFYIMSGQTTG